MISIGEIIGCLELNAHPTLQESYDNAGLLTGQASTEAKGVLVCLDSTEEVIEEAIRRGCNLIVAHHPIIFSGLKKINGKTYVERAIIKAIKHDIAIYAIHTNLDNVIKGVNAKIAEKLGLKDIRILNPKPNLLKKLVTFVPHAAIEQVSEALFAAGAGHVGNYDECGFQTIGSGTFRGNESSNPVIGEKGKRHTEAETRFETIFPVHLEHTIIQALKKAHPYEEVAYEVYSLDNQWQEVGSGIIGQLTEALEPLAFLNHLKKSMNLPSVKYTPVQKQIKTVAVCGGSGSFLLKKAIGVGADAYVSADFKYHEYFDAEKHLMIADIGHYESEIFTTELLRDIILKNFPTFAVLLTEINTNPIKYY
ncbi:MAG: Nif3-like dinuclear metal center hexameric protein [Bacteroidota bacterium]|jgi:dinuclear metal center YbgI/SA1388 family protein